VSTPPRRPTPATGTIWSASPTPFTADGDLDQVGIENLVRQHAQLGVCGLFLGGSCGEGPFLPNRQRADLVESFRRAAGDDFHLAVQVSDTSAPRVQVNIAEAVTAGADSVVIAAPWLLRFVHPDSARRYFLETLERDWPVPVGIYILNQPPETGLDLDFWLEIAGHGNVAYVKDSTSKIEYRQALLALKRERPNLTLRTGDEFDVVAALADGYDGCLLGTAVLNAGLIGRAVEALRRGDRDAADRWQAHSNALLHDLFRPDISSWMPGLKHALKTLGLFTTEYAHIMGPLTDEDRQRIATALEREKEYI